MFNTEITVAGTQVLATVVVDGDDLAVFSFGDGSRDMHDADITDVCDREMGTFLVNGVECTMSVLEFIAIEAEAFEYRLQSRGW